jgi:sirohydrochlorin cobaltochelatase
VETAATALILFGHGSRDPLWRQPIEAVASRVTQRSPAVRVRCAYLELNAPDLRAATAQLALEGVQAITIVPMFLGIGKHVRDDLPVLIARLRTEFPAIVFTLQRAVGEDPRLVDLLAGIALE